MPDEKLNELIKDLRKLSKQGYKLLPYQSEARCGVDDDEPGIETTYFEIYMSKNKDT